MKITLYNGVNPNRVRDISVDVALNRIRDGASKELIEQIRKGNKDLKLKLPGATFAGTFNKRKKDSLINSSQLACIDIDHVHDATFIKQQLFNQYEQVYAAWISPSGDGVKALIKIPVVKDDGEYKKYYHSIIGTIPNCDKTDDISRLTFESYDPDILVRDWEKTSTWNDKADQPARPVKTKRHHALNTAAEMIDKAADGEKHDKLRDAARLCGGYIAGGELGEGEVTAFLLNEIQQRDIDSLEAATRTISDGIRDGKQNPISKNPFIQLDNFFKDWDIRQNVVKMCVEQKQGNDWIELNENDLYGIVKRKGIKINKTDFTSYINSNAIKRVDPIRDYFLSLHDWDGVDHIGKLAGYVEVKGDVSFFQRMFKMHLVRCVRQALDTNMVNRWIFVLQGDYHNGKTEFIRFLNPFGDDYYIESTPHQESHIPITLSSHFIWSIDELKEMDRSDRNSFKSMLSSNGGSHRKLYASQYTKLDRRVNFFGTTNDEQIPMELNTARWMIFSIDKIHYDYHNIKTGQGEVDIHDVWSQAYALFKDGYGCDPSEEDRAVIAKISKEYEYETLEEEYIKRFTRKPDELASEQMKAMDEIISHFIEEGSTGRSARDFNKRILGRRLSELGYEKRNRGDGVRYYIKLIDDVPGDVSDVSGDVSYF